MAPRADPPLVIQHVADVAAAQEVPWLVDGLWPEEGVGFIGGHPKSCKSWLALELALSVTSGTPMFGAFDVTRRRKALIFAAEDSPPMVRARLAGMAAARGVELGDMPLHLVLADRLRLEHARDQRRLTAALKALRPSLLILDPFVRLSGIDENSAQEVSRVLGFLRELQRELGLAIVVVHHVRKSAGSGGLALRGSGDFWAWSDTNWLVKRRRDGLELAIEQRSAAAVDPIGFELVAGGEAGPYLRAVERDADDDDDERPLEERVTVFLAERDRPASTDEVREAMRARKQRVVDILRGFEEDGRAERVDGRWRLVTD